MENPNYENVGIVPQEVALRSKIGVALNKEELDKVAETAKMLIGNDDFREGIREIRENYFYSLLSHGRVGGEYIVKSLMNKNKKKKEN